MESCFHGLPFPFLRKFFGRVTKNLSIVILGGAKRSRRIPWKVTFKIGKPSLGGSAASVTAQPDLKARPRSLRELRYGSTSLGMTSNGQLVSSNS